MPELPSDGVEVTAQTYASAEYDRAAEWVRGKLVTRPSPFGDPPQCWVEDKQIDPATVEEHTDRNDEDSDEDYE